MLSRMLSLRRRTHIVTAAGDKVQRSPSILGGRDGARRAAP